MFGKDQLPQLARAEAERFQQTEFPAALEHIAATTIARPTLPSSRPSPPSAWKMER